jgi:hypothetical protein
VGRPQQLTLPVDHALPAQHAGTKVGKMRWQWRQIDPVDEVSQRASA